jgi:nicotinate-nucleotide adenylyltransferase
LNIALFGGTFDPVHRGHLEVARAAVRRFRLQQVLFVPANVPPHKQRQPVSSFHHRFAMLALGTAGEKRFVPSLLEAPDGEAANSPSYSILTVRRVKQALGKRDRLFFIIGIDAFLDIATWREPAALLREAEFIVASRPGFSLADVGNALPESLRPEKRVIAAMRRAPAAESIVLDGVRVHLLADVRVPLSGTNIRSAAASGRSIAKHVPPAVAEYIRKTHLYQEERRGAASFAKERHRDRS